MTKKEIAAKIKETEEQLTTLRKQLEEPEPILYRLFKGGYFFINSFGAVGYAYDDGLGTNYKHFNSGNYFHSCEQAARRAKREAALRVLQNLADELNGEILLRGGSSLHVYNNRIKVEYSVDQPGTTRFKTFELARRALAALPLEHRRELFGDAKADWED